MADTRHYALAKAPRIHTESEPSSTPRTLSDEDGHRSIIDCNKPWGGVLTVEGQCARVVGECGEYIRM